MAAIFLKNRVPVGVHHQFITVKVMHVFESPHQRPATARSVLLLSVFAIAWSTLDHVAASGTGDTVRMTCALGFTSRQNFNHTLDVCKFCGYSVAQTHSRCRRRRSSPERRDRIAVVLLKERFSQSQRNDHAIGRNDMPPHLLVDLANSLPQQFAFRRRACGDRDPDRRAASFETAPRYRRRPE